MTLHNIEEQDLPRAIKKNYKEYMKSKNKKSTSDLQPESARAGTCKTLSTGRKQIHHKIETDISHVPVSGGDMVTLRNKDKKVNIKKGLEDSLLDSLSSKSKSITRNKDKHQTSKADLSHSNGNDSLQALDELMP